MPRRRPGHVRFLASAAAVLASLAAARPAGAQLPSAGAASLGLGGNYTAVARGRNATAWNPANLAMPGGPGFSLALAPTRAFAGISPITLADVAEFQGTLIPAQVKEEWLRRIIDEGRMRGAFGVDVTELSLNIGRVGLQVSSTVAGKVDVGPDAAELLLFGNAGRTGDPRDFDLAGSALDGSMTTTIALSYAQSLAGLARVLPGDRIAVGATFKYTVGQFLISGADDGSRVTDDPLTIGLAFPIIHSDTTPAFNNGAGIGLDLGAAWHGGPLTLGAVVRNVINTFSWDESRLLYRPGTVVFEDSSETHFDAEPLENAPASIRERAARLVDERTYDPSLAVGAALRLLPALTVSADVRHRLGTGLEIGPATHAGVGAEFRPLSYLPLRAGVSAVSGGYQYAGGLGLDFGRVNIDVAAAHRRSDVGEDGVVMASLSFGGS